MKEIKSQNFDCSASEYEVREKEEIKLTFNFVTVWSFCILFFNVWTAFSQLFWPSVKGWPANEILFLELIVEFILFIDIVTRIVLFRFFSEIYKNMELIHADKKDTFTLLCILFIASFPQLTLFTILGRFYDLDLENGNLMFLIFLKLLRIAEISRCSQKLEKIFTFRSTKWLITIKLILLVFWLIYLLHVAACAWMFINKKTTDSFFERENFSSAGLVEHYIYSVSWAICTMTGNSFGDVSPKTDWEMVVSLVIMVLGVTFYAKTISDLQGLLYFINSAKIENRSKYESTKEFCIDRKIPVDIRKRIKVFFNMNETTILESQYIELIQKLPKSLKTELMLYINREMIAKVNIFNLGTPSFIIAIAQYFVPRIYMEGDIIVRQGEKAEEMFFIKSGEVEVISVDKVILAELGPGAYFGEIGCLLNQKRTVTVKATSVCTMNVIARNKLKEVLLQFPDQAKLMRKVAKQRSKVRYYFEQDASQGIVNQIIVKGKDFFFGDGAKKEDDKETKAQNGNLDDFEFSSILDNSFLELFKVDQLKVETEKFTLNKPYEETEPSLGTQRFYIKPLSKFFFVWALVLTCGAGFNLFYIPYSISFNTKAVGIWIILDNVIRLINIVDIFVNANTAIIFEDKLISNKQTLFWRYINKYMGYDLLACFPFDYIFEAVFPEEDLWAKIIRLFQIFKIVRVYEMFVFLKESTTKKTRYLGLIWLALIHVYLTHISACMMKLIADHERRHGNTNSRGDNFYSKINRYALWSRKDLEIPTLEEQSPWNQFINFLYWAFACSGGGSYGDIWGVTVPELIFQIFCILFFRIYSSFLAAEITNMVSLSTAAYSAHSDKVADIVEWLEHNRLPVVIVQRVKHYYRCIWERFKGFNEEIIFENMPESIKNDIQAFILRDVTEKVNAFPRNEPNFQRVIIKRFSFLLIPKDEYVFREGEIATEVCFILEGKAAVLDSDYEKILAVLREYEYFGEMGIIDGKAGTRTKPVKALTNLYLAILNIDDTVNISKEFPEFMQKLQRRAQQRAQANKSTKATVPVDRRHSFITRIINDSAGRIKSDQQNSNTTLMPSTSSIDEKTDKETQENSIRNSYQRQEESNLTVHHISSLAHQVKANLSASEKREQSEGRSGGNRRVHNSKLFGGDHSHSQLLAADVYGKSLGFSSEDLSYGVDPESRDPNVAPTFLQFTNDIPVFSDSILPGSVAIETLQDELDSAYERANSASWKQAIAENGNNSSDHYNFVKMDDGDDFISVAYGTAKDDERLLKSHEVLLIKAQEDEESDDIVRRGEANEALTFRKAPLAFPDLKKDNESDSNGSVSSANSALNDSFICSKSHLSFEVSSEQESKFISQLSQLQAQKILNNTPFEGTKPSGPSVIAQNTRSFAQSRSTTLRESSKKSRGKFSIFKRTNTSVKGDFIGNSESVKKPNPINFMAKNNFLKKLSHKGRLRALRNCVLFLIFFWNAIFIPLHLAYDRLPYTGSYLFIELLTMVILFFDFGRNLHRFSRYYKKTKGYLKRNVVDVSKMFHHKTKRVTRKKLSKTRNIAFIFIRALVTEVFTIIPFPLLFDMFEVRNRRSSLMLIALQCIRICRIRRLFMIFENFKNYNAMIRILRILYSYMLLSHVQACLWIVMGNSVENKAETWLAKLVAPQLNWPHSDPEPASDGTIYISALYFSYVTTSHVGVGDVNAASNAEKTVCIIYIIIGIYAYFFLFGNIATLVGKLRSRFKAELQTKYKLVMDHIKNHQLETYTEKKYFNYLWTTNKGLSDSYIMKLIPDYLRAEVHILHYSEAIFSSDVFKDLQDETYIGIIYSFFKFCNFETFMPDDYILTEGQPVARLLFVLDGEGDIDNCGTTLRKFTSGDMFGYLLPENMFSTYSLKAQKICKFAILQRDQQEMLVNAFPKWKEILEKKNLTLRRETANQDDRKKEKNYVPSMSRKKLNKPLKIGTGWQKLLNMFDIDSLSSFAKASNKSSNQSEAKAISVIPPVQPTTTDHQNQYAAWRERRQSVLIKARQFNEDLAKFPDQSFEEKKIVNTTAIQKNESTDPPASVIDFKNAKTSPIKESIGSKENRDRKQVQKRRFTLTTKNFGNLSTLLMKNVAFTRQQKRHGFATILNKRLKSEKVKIGELKGWYLHPTSNKRLFFDILHLVVILYSGFSLPIIVGFKISTEYTILVLEILCQLEIVFYIFIKFRTALYVQGILTLNFRHILRDYQENGLIVDLIAAVPLNMILMKVSLNWFTGLIRVSRIIQTFQLSRLLTAIETKWRDITPFINIFKSVLMLCFVWVWTSCAWYYWERNNKEIFCLDSVSASTECATWIERNGLINDEQEFTVGFTKQLIYALLFTMNIATTTGYFEGIVYNDYERLFFILIIYIGDALFAIAFALISSSSTLFSAQYDRHMEDIKDINYLESKGAISYKIKTKIDKYINYIIKDNKPKSTSAHELEEILPTLLVQDITLSENKSILHRCAYFQQITSHQALIEISEKLNLSVYLPEDYVFMKGTRGEEIYFVIDGAINLLGDHNRKCLATIREGEYFGEDMLFYPMRHKFSAVAKKYSVLACLTNKDLTQVFESYPAYKELFKAASELRYQDQIKERAEKHRRHQERKNFQKMRRRVEPHLEDSSDEEDTPCKKDDDRKNKILARRPKNLTKNLDAYQKIKNAVKNDRAFDLHKIKLITDSNSDGECDSSDSSTVSLTEFVEIDELESEYHKNKPSRRVKQTNALARRFSRVSLGKEQKISKHSDFEVKWGISLK